MFASRGEWGGGKPHLFGTDRQRDRIGRPYYMSSLQATSHLRCRLCGPRLVSQHGHGPLFLTRQCLTVIWYARQKQGRTDRIALYTEPKRDFTDSPPSDLRKRKEETKKEKKRKGKRRKEKKRKRKRKERKEKEKRRDKKGGGGHKQGAPT